MNYDFTLTLKGVRETTEEEGNRLYDCGCDDSLLFSRDGVAFVGFSREAPTLDAAISSAIADVKKAGFSVERIEVEPEQFATA